MSIIRELITRIAFQVDPKGIKEFNKAILGFKTKFALASTAATGFALGILKTASNISNAVLDTNELARSVGIATNEFVGLQRAAARFRISPQQFNQGIQFLSEQRRLARSGEGALIKEALQSGLILRDANGELKGLKQLYEEIILRISKINNLQDRQQKSLELLGSTRFADVAIEFDEFQRLSQELQPIGEEIAQAEESAQKFNTSLTTLYDTADKFKLKFASPILDGLTTVLNAFDKTIGRIEAYFKAYEESVEEASKFPFGINPKIIEAFKNVNTVRPDLFPVSNQAGNRNDVRVNTINVNVNGEVGIQNRDAGEKMIKAGFMSALEQIFESVGNNFPVVE